MGAEDPRGAARDPDREALHQARGLHALCEPDLPRARGVRRGGRFPHLLRQEREGPHGRRGGAHRGHHPVTEPPEPLREHGERAPAAQLCPVAHGDRRLHQRLRRRGRAQAADRDDRPARAARFRGALLRRGGPQAPRVELRRAAALRARAQRPDRPRRAPAGRGEPRGRRRASQAGQAEGLAEASTERPDGAADARGVLPAPVGGPDGRGRRRARRGGGCRRRAHPRARGCASRRDRQGRLRVDRQTTGAARQDRRSRGGSGRQA